MNVTGERSLGRALGKRAAEAASGVLTVTRGKLKRIFCLQDGRIVFAASNLVEEQFGEYLVRHGLLQPAQRADAAEETAKQKKKLAQLLEEQGTVLAGDLRRAMEGLVQSLLSSSLEMADVTFAFEPGQPQLEGEALVRLHPVHLVLRHAQRFPVDLDAVRARIGPPDTRLARVAQKERAMSSIQHSDVVRFVLSNCDGSTDISKLVSASPSGEQETLRALYGLLLVGAVEPSRRKDEAEEAAKGPPLTREECLAILGKMEGADHYGILGLTRNSIPGQIRGAYYALARRYHPDRFRAGTLQDLLPRMEAYFTKVTEAYNTLSNVVLRAEYDGQLVGATEAESRQSETSYLARQNFVRAKALLEKKRYADATVFLENAVKLDASQAEYHLELGVVLTRNPRRRAEAERELIRAAELEPAATAAYLALGQLYQRAGRNPDAARMYREVLRWDPEHALASALISEVGDAPDSGEGGVLRSLFGG